MKLGILESDKHRINDSPITKMDKIQIVLQEYSSLRNEIIHRTNNIFQLLASSNVAVWWFMNTERYGFRYIISFAIYLILVSLLFWLISRDIGKAADRIAEIEIFVDRETNEWYLMRWERIWGGRKTGFWGKAQPLQIPARVEHVKDQNQSAV